MTKQYRICLILPEQNPHALCFKEIGLLLMSALRSNKLECDFTINQPDPDKINIILGYHLLKFEPNLAKIQYIPYQLEQLHSEEYPFNNNLKQILQNASGVWDYSEKNIDFLKQQGISAKQIIPGYHENLEIIHRKPNQSVDVLFYGSIAVRRKMILDELSAICKVKTLFGVYGEKRDKWISRSKIVLNHHHYSTKIFESVRNSFLLNNKCPIISETSVDYPYPKVNLPMVPYEKLVETCSHFLGDPGEMNQITNENYENFKKHYHMTELIKNVLD
ncbi:MAG: hypothetical protein GY757_62390 [bacterium]|nr:hypothetical protein [bacterium]